VRLRALAASDPPNRTPELKRGNRSRFDQAGNQLIADDVVYLIQEGRFRLVRTWKTGNLDIIAGLVAGRIKGLMLTGGGAVSRRGGKERIALWGARMVENQPDEEAPDQGHRA
jgi:hypothetical protein